jgi:hypothetical protein
LTGSRLACASLASAQARRATSETAVAAWTEVGVRSDLLDMISLRRPLFHLVLLDLVLHVALRLSLFEIELAYFSLPQCEAVHRCKKIFEGEWEKSQAAASVLRALQRRVMVTFALPMLLE